VENELESQYCTKVISCLLLGVAVVITKQSARGFTRAADRVTRGLGTPHQKFNFGFSS
jgi:hypothetical protein